ncbi:hypothetical protein RDABS01_022304 [Bienertia sinuspersici]
MINEYSDKLTVVNKDRQKQGSPSILVARFLNKWSMVQGIGSVIPGAIVMNIGDLEEVIPNVVFKSVVHRFSSAPTLQEVLDL